MFFFLFDRVNVEAFSNNLFIEAVAINLFTAIDFIYFFKHVLFPESPVWWCSLLSLCNAIELVISVKRVRVKDRCKTSPLSVMTLLFIGPYFISSSVSGKSFPHGTVDTMIFIYSVHITCGQLSDLPFVRARTLKTILLLWLLFFF